jgi:hypothetical protein
LAIFVSLPCVKIPPALLLYKVCPADPPVLTVVATGVPVLPVVVLAVGAACAAVPVAPLEVEV